MEEQTGRALNHGPQEETFAPSEETFAFEKTGRAVYGERR